MARRRHTIETIKASTGVELEMKKLLDTSPIQDRYSSELSQWMEKVFTTGRRLGHQDNEIIEWVRAYSIKGNWSNSQISYILNRNGIQRSKQNRNPTGYFKPIHYIYPFKRIVQGITGLDEYEVMKTNSQKELADKAMPNVLQVVSRMSEYEMFAYTRQMTELRIAIDLMQSTIEEKKKSKSQELGV